MVWIWVALGLIGAGFLLAVVALAFPVRLQFLTEAEPRLRARIRLSLLNGLVPAIPLVDSWRPRGKRQTSGTQKKERSPTERRKRKLPPDGLGRLIVELLARVRIRRLRVRAVVGLADPAETGHLYGLLCPLKYGLPGGSALIDVTPDFSGPRLEGRAEGVVSLVPLALVPPLMRFGWRAVRARA